jgi:hypothetical protein
LYLDTANEKGGAARREQLDGVRLLRAATARRPKPVEPAKAEIDSLEEPKVVPWEIALVARL